MKYYFRGILVFDYDPDTKQVVVPNTEIREGNFNFCNFIPDDYELMAKYFTMVHKHATGEITEDELNDIEVY